jgi:Spy/CpxP family protein refolding chaperone
MAFSVFSNSPVFGVPMRFARAFSVCMFLLGLGLLSADSLQGQDKKDKEKSKGQLPANWGKLGLTDEQKVNIYKVQGEYKDKIDKLREEVKKLQAEERKKMAAFLTDDQKKKLAELSGIEDSKEKTKEKGKEKTKE